MSGQRRKDEHCCFNLHSETEKDEWSKKEGRTLRFQPSHAGRRSTPEHWTTDEWGKTLADVAVGADSNTDLVTSAGHKIALEEIPPTVGDATSDGERPVVLVTPHGTSVISGWTP